MSLGVIRELARWPRGGRRRPSTCQKSYSLVLPDNLAFRALTELCRTGRGKGGESRMRHWRTATRRNSPNRPSFLCQSQAWKRPSLNFGPDERGDVIKRTLRGGGGALFLSEECAEEGDEEEASFSDQKHLPKRFFC